MSDDKYCLSAAPALLAGEDNERYLKKRKAIEDYVKPANIIEEMLVDDCHSACNIDPLSRGIGVQN